MNSQCTYGSCLDDSSSNFPDKDDERAREATIFLLMRKKEVIYPVSFLDEREREPRPKDYHLFPNGHKRVSTQSIAIPYIYIFLLEREELLLLAHAYYIILCQWYGQAVFLTFDDIFLAGWLVDSVYNTNTRPPGLPYI